MSNFHPYIVHFPVALLTFSLLFELLARLRKNEMFSRVGWWSQLAGTIGLASAVATGLITVRKVHIALIAKPYVDMHQQIAFIVTATFAVLFLWRISSKSRIPERYAALYLIILFVSTIALWAGAGYGGELVYRFGVGIRGLKAF